MKYKVSKESVDKLFPINDFAVLGYESPITMITEQIAEDIAKQTDDAIWEAIVKTEIVVDKDELVKAMQYDRDQYAKGYRNGYKAAYEKLPRWAQKILGRRMQNDGT